MDKNNFQEMRDMKKLKRCILKLTTFESNGLESKSRKEGHRFIIFISKVSFAEKVSLKIRNINCLTHGGNVSKII